MAKSKGRISVNKTRGFLYLLAKLLGDFQAARQSRRGGEVNLGKFFGNLNLQNGLA